MFENPFAGKKQPVILCLGRSIQKMRIKKEHKELVAGERFLIISPFTEKQRRPSVETAFIVIICGSFG